jgi:hypothetical protein
MGKTMDRRQLLGAALVAGLTPSQAFAAVSDDHTEDPAKTIVTRQINRFYSSFNEGDWDSLTVLLTPVTSIFFGEEGSARGARETVVETLKSAQANVRYRVAHQPSQTWLASDPSIKQIDAGPILFPNDHTAVVMVERANVESDGSATNWLSYPPYDLIHIFSFLYSGNGRDASLQLFNRIDMVRG